MFFIIREIYQIKQLDGFIINITELELKHKIGEGAFAEVFLSVYKGKNVAVKTLKSSKFQAFNSWFREASLFRRMPENPHILHCFGCCADPLCIVTEYMEGGSLFDALHTHKWRLRFSQIFQVALNICNGMKHLHSLKPPIIHRDLTSHNVLLKLQPSADGTLLDCSIKIGDFGISRAKEKKGPLAMSAIGNPRWTAPEIINKQPYTKRADVFSFGMVLYELVSKKFPSRKLSLIVMLPRQLRC